MKDEITIKKSTLIHVLITIGVGVGSFIGGFMMAVLLGFYHF